MIVVIRILESEKAPWKGHSNIILDVFKADVNYRDACKAALKEYLETPEGANFFYKKKNDWNIRFSWRDVKRIPNEICERHGFRKIQEVDEHIVSDADSLIEGTFLISNIKWDAGGDGPSSENCNPEEYQKVEVPFEDLLETILDTSEGNRAEDYSIKKLKDGDDSPLKRYLADIIAEDYNCQYDINIKSFDVDYI